MYSHLSHCKRCLTALTLAAAIIAGGSAQAATREAIDLAYKRMIDAEKRRVGRAGVIERIASGAAAFSIGIYGFLTDHRGNLTKVVYSATQTAGVFMISDALTDGSTASQLLTLDRESADGTGLTRAELKRTLVTVEHQRVLAEYRELAITSLVLGGIYGYSGYRERRNEGPLANGYFFLAFTSGLVSVANSYKFAVAESRADAMSFRVLPLPSLTYRF